MFGGPGMEQPPSAEEIREAEIQSSATVKNAVITCVVLYVAPFAIDFVRKLV
ncbi:hypothetical protein TWF730_005363 [Orbilia blumenaviensis]|uniref:Mitochondrial import receptor subunit TOM5-like protein n=1 Tax=Orbilia blumenaviensis TaxID=1796055 RepID=A0AAV9VI56_9PEZI